jgi:hypothetical protein
MEIHLHYINELYAAKIVTEIELTVSAAAASLFNYRIPIKALYAFIFLLK